VGFSSKRFSPPSYQKHAFSKAPWLHGRYPLLRYYGPLRLPLGTQRLCFPAACWLCATQEGLPGSSTDLSTRAAPYHPGKPSGCLPVASPPVSGFILVGGLATSVFLSRPNRVHLRCGSRVRPCQCFARWVSPSRARWATCRTGNLHGELLSVHKSARLILAYRPSGSACLQSSAAKTLPHGRGSDGVLLRKDSLDWPTLSERHPLPSRTPRSRGRFPKPWCTMRYY